MATAREMSNMIFLWNDAITETASVDIQGHSTEVAGYVAENLLDDDRQTCFMTSATGDDVYIEVDLQSNHTIVGFALLNHNAGTMGVSNFTIKYGTSSPASTTLLEASVSSYLGDDDFFVYPVSGVTARYVRYEFDSVDASPDLYMGRMFLAQSAYNYTYGLRIGAQKGVIGNTDIISTKGGTEHRTLRGSQRKRLSAVIPNNSGMATDRAALISLLEHVKGNYKAFVHSWPYGTTSYSGNNRYGQAVHARWANPEWLYSMLAAGGADIPIETIEDL